MELTKDTLGHHLKRREDLRKKFVLLCGEKTHNEVIAEMVKDPEFGELEWGYHAIRKMRKLYKCQPQWGGKRVKGQKSRP